jgi:hypothetical protein
MAADLFADFDPRRAVPTMTLDARISLREILQRADGLAAELHPDSAVGASAVEAAEVAVDAYVTETRKGAIAHLPAMRARVYELIDAGASDAEIARAQREVISAPEVAYRWNAMSDTEARALVELVGTSREWAPESADAALRAGPLAGLERRFARAASTLGLEVTADVARELAPMTR